ncbi:MAG: hypothetical protein EOO39_07905 [Cytophagaceae bacterium]|nr:MAG: hypothetical protein EOO39_07905 [Cytophagaceae bacterium]
MASRGTISRTNTTPLVDEVMRELDMVIYKAQAVIEVAPLGAIRGDGTQLMQLFRNLLSNALKFKKPGVPLHIKLDSVSVSREELPDTYQPGREHGQFCAIRISDNGIGFAQEKAAYIFGAFNRLHGRSQIPGTGLGLSIVQRVVDNHQGYIDAQSQPGQGATFSVYLPI